MDLRAHANQFIFVAALSAKHSVYGTAIDRVLAMPELLELVFSHLAKRDLFRNALVCKAFSSVALDLLWRDMGDLPQIFRLLAATASNHLGDVRNPHS